MLAAIRTGLPADVRKGSAFPIQLITLSSARLNLADELNK